jgi:hypothetical protein
MNNLLKEKRAKNVKEEIEKSGTTVTLVKISKESHKWGL